LKKITKANKMKIDWTFWLAFFGALAWIPQLWDILAPVRISGKIISIYENVGTFAGKPKNMFIFKLAVVASNHSYHLKDVDVNIKYKNGGWTNNTAVNQRHTYFTWDSTTKELLVPESSFLNNFPILKKDESSVGYIMVTTPQFGNDSIDELKFIFKSFKGGLEELAFKKEDIVESKLAFDDSIWKEVDQRRRAELMAQIPTR
jgi:hypothetical protein